MIWVVAEFDSEARRFADQFGWRRGRDWLLIDSVEKLAEISQHEPREPYEITIVDGSYRRPDWARLERQIGMLRAAGWATVTFARRFDPPTP